MTGNTVPITWELRPRIPRSAEHECDSGEQKNHTRKDLRLPYRDRCAVQSSASKPQRQDLCTTEARRHGERQKINGSSSDRQPPDEFIQGRVSIFRPCLPSRKMRARKHKGRELDFEQKIVFAVAFPAYLCASCDLCGEDFGVSSETDSMLFTIDGGVESYPLEGHYARS